MNENLQKYTDLAIEYGLKAVIALVAFYVGIMVINRLIRLLKKALSKSKVDRLLVGFLTSLLGAFAKVMLVIIIVSTFGVETTSLVAVLGAAGLAIGLALQGSLSNFAGGALILFFKPFKVGDRIETQGEVGKVKDIQIFNTILENRRKEVIVVPNGELSNNVIKNLTGRDLVGVEITYGIGYSDDIDKAKNIIREVLESDPRVSKEEGVTIGVNELADSSVNILSRCFVKQADFWDTKFDTMEKIKKEFDSNGISIPFPQVDVNLNKQ